jgi:hypothetical protein
MMIAIERKRQKDKTYYSHEQANPHEGSTNRQTYMTKAPLTGYMTDISARACIMR